MDKFIQLLNSKIEDKNLDHLLNVLLTPSERKNIEERIQILDLLSKGKTQREIAKSLNISITTVTRGNRILSEYKKLFTEN